MNEYEVLVQTVNPCGGEKHDKKEFLEIETDSPEKWVRANAAFPIIDQVENADGDLVIITGDGKGNFVRYTFSA